MSLPWKLLARSYRREIGVLGAERALAIYYRDAALEMKRYFEKRIRELEEELRKEKERA